MPPKKAKLKSSKRKHLESPFTFKWPRLIKDDEEIVLKELKRIIQEEGLQRPISKRKCVFKKSKSKQTKTEPEVECTKVEPEEIIVDAQNKKNIELQDATSENAQVEIQTSTTLNKTNKLTSWFVFGIGHLTKSLERNLVSAVVIFTFGAPGHMFRHLYLMTSQKDIPLVVLNQPDSDIAPLLNLKSAAAYGLKIQEQKDENYTTLLNLLEQKSVKPHDMRNILGPNMNESQASKKIKLEENPEPVLEKFVVQKSSPKKRPFQIPPLNNKEEYFSKFSFTSKDHQKFKSMPLPDLKNLIWT